MTDIDKAVLEECQKQLTRIANQRSPSPIRKYIRCHISGGDGTLYASDGEVSARYCWHTDPDAEAKLLIDPAKLPLRHCGDVVTFEERGNTVKVSLRWSDNIKSGTYEYETPDWLDIEDDREDAVDTLVFPDADAVAKLRAALTRAKIAADHEGSSRYALQGVCVCVAKGSWCVVGTDGRRVSICPLQEGESEGQYILPEPLAATMLGVLEGVEFADLLLCRNSATLIAGQWTVSGRLLEGRFPDVSQLAQGREQSLVCEVDPDQLAACCEIAKPCITGESAGADLTSDHAGISLSTQKTPEGQAFALFGGAGAEKAFTARLNVRYLADLARVADRSPIEWRAESPSGGQTFAQADWLHTIMPLAVEA